MKHLVLLFAATSLIASAQSASGYSGKWSATVHGDASRKPLDAELIVSGDGGTWKVFLGDRKAKNHPCIGRQFPITIQQQTPTTFVFSIEASKVIQGCEDRVATVMRTNSNTLEGRFNDGELLKLVSH
jgi:hypothetical protein